MSFDDHDRCRRCGDFDGPSHTATECERVMAQRREAQRAHDSQKTAPDSSLPLVTRRTDGKRFRIVCQARSPDGPVDLVACDGPPFERVSVRGTEFVHTYEDPRKTAPLPDPLAPSDRCGHAGLCAWMKSAVHGPLAKVPATTEAVFTFVRREMEHPDTLATVTRYVVTGNGGQRIVRACPTCGGNPNETQVMR